MNYLNLKVSLQTDSVERTLYDTMSNALCLESKGKQRLNLIIDLKKLHTEII